MGKVPIKDKLGQYASYLPKPVLTAIEKEFEAIYSLDQNIRNRHKMEFGFLDRFFCGSLESLEAKDVDRQIQVMPPSFIDGLMLALGFIDWDYEPYDNKIAKDWTIAEECPEEWEVELGSSVWDDWVAFLTLHDRTTIRIEYDWYNYKITFRPI